MSKKSNGGIDMKATDLMINDLILFKGKPFKVHSEFIMFYDKGEYNKNIDISPIPLTEDILKANGFINDWRQLELEYIDKGNGWFLVDIEAESIEDGVVTKWCRYVHEVQHALRICKRNELADNFKLK